MMKPRLTVIAGPTASGKTACAVALCLKTGGEVISADSMQVYRGMDILTASPTADEMRGVPHHMLGRGSIRRRNSPPPGIGKWQTAALRRYWGAAGARCSAAARGCISTPSLRPMAFSERCDEATRRALMDIAAQPGGRRRLHDMLSEIDPEAAERLHENDVRRVSRAIEVYRLTGRTQREQAEMDAAREGDYDEKLFILSWPREVLYRRIDQRVERMLEAGLIGEVERLRADEARHPTALQAIGYKEIAAALDGALSMDEAIVLVKQRVTQLRQKTDDAVQALPARRSGSRPRGAAQYDIADEILSKSEDIRPMSSMRLPESGERGRGGADRARRGGLRRSLQARRRDRIRQHQADHRRVSEASRIRAAFCAHLL